MDRRIVANCMERTMVAFTRLGQALVRLVGAAAVLLLLGQAMPAAHAAPAAATISLVGTWLGNALGAPGRCGKEYGQFTFFPNGKYAYTENSEVYPKFTCGGITNTGHYTLRNGVLYLHWVRCNFACQPGAASVHITFIGVNTFEFRDAGQSYYYHRQ